MGTWGTGISSNDSYADVYGDFFNLYNQGRSVSEITTKLIQDNQEIINTPEDQSNFWFALANAQWECKELSNEVLLKVEEIINSGQDLANWKESGASPKDIKARRNVLNKFLLKLKKEKNSAKKRVKKKLYSSLFKKGDCLIYLMDNANYGGAFVLTDEENTEAGINTIAITTIDKIDKPTLDDFLTAEIYIKRQKMNAFTNGKLTTEWQDQPQIGDFYSAIVKDDLGIEVVGQLIINKKYETKHTVGFGWTVLKTYLPYDNEYIKINGRPSQGLKLIDLISESSLIKRIISRLIK